MHIEPRNLAQYCILSWLEMLIRDHFCLALMNHNTKQLGESMSFTRLYLLLFQTRPLKASPPHVLVRSSKSNSVWFIRGASSRLPAIEVCFSDEPRIIPAVVVTRFIPSFVEQPFNCLKACESYCCEPPYMTWNPNFINLYFEGDGR